MIPHTGHSKFWQRINQFLCWINIKWRALDKGASTTNLKSFIWPYSSGVWCWGLQTVRVNALSRVFSGKKFMPHLNRNSSLEPLVQALINLLKFQWFIMRNLNQHKIFVFFTHFNHTSFKRFGAQHLN